MRRIIKIRLKQLSFKVLLITALIGCGFASCTYHTNDYDPLEVPDNVSFEADIIPIFEAGCVAAGCHNGTIPPDLRPEVAYRSLINGGYVTDLTTAENNSLYQSIDGGSMTVYASDLDRAYIKKWIEEGALDN